MSLAYSIIKDHTESEDAVQEAFIRVFKSAKKFKHDCAFSTWLYKIVVNISKTKLSKSLKRGNFESNYDIDPIIPHPDSSFDLLVESDKKHIVNTILEKIKPDHSLILRLFYLADQDIRSIIKITGFKESKIKVSLHRGRKEFLNELEKFLGKEINEFR